MSRLISTVPRLAGLIGAAAGFVLAGAAAMTLGGNPLISNANASDPVVPGRIILAQAPAPAAPAQVMYCSSMITRSIVQPGTTDSAIG